MIPFPTYMPDLVRTPPSDYDERDGTAAVLCDCSVTPVLHAHEAPWSGGLHGHYDVSVFHNPVRIASEAEILSWREWP